MGTSMADLSVCASGIGCRVVRGPDWKWGDQDGGDGHVGSLRRFEARGEAVVLWDSGIVANYRCGALGFDLRVLDSSPTGEKHADTICEGCNEAPIYGIRWKCMVCLNVDLCSSCYHGDKHRLNHHFLRIAAPQRTRVAVGRRLTTRKTEAFGLFPKARVVRGFDWRWGTQDCCAEGVVNTLLGPTVSATSASTGNRDILSVPCQGRIIDRRNWYQWAPRSAVSVAWDSGAYNVYRVGYMGMVDLKAVRPSKGGYYYSGHLPLLADLRDFPEDSLESRPPVWQRRADEIASASGESNDGGNRVQLTEATVDVDSEVAAMTLSSSLGVAENGGQLFVPVRVRGRNVGESTMLRQQPQRSGNSSRTLADLFCGGERNSVSPSLAQQQAQQQQNIRPPRCPASDVGIRPSVPAATLPTRTLVGPNNSQTVGRSPASLVGATLRLRPGAVIQLRFRSSANETSCAPCGTSEYLSLPSVVERVDDTNGSVVLMIPLTGQRFTLTSSQQQQCAAAAAASATAQTGCGTPQSMHGRATECEVRNNSRNAASNLLTRIRRRDSCSRSNPPAAVVTYDTPTVASTPQPSTSQSDQEAVDGAMGTRNQSRQSVKQVAEELMFAAAEGNLKKITWLIKHREIDINTHYAGATALHIACQSGHLNCVDVLLKHGADCKQRDADGNEALHSAAQGGCLNVLRRIASLSLEPTSMPPWTQPLPSTSSRSVESGGGGGEGGGGADASVDDVAQALGVVLGVSGGRLEPVIMAGQSSPDVNSRNSLRQTPLHLATVGRHLSCVRCLLNEFNAISSLQDCDGDTPLHDAISGQNLAMVEVLLAERADLSITNSVGHNCLHHAALLGDTGIFCALLAHCDITPWLLDEPRPDGFTPLHLAVLYGHLDIVDCLLLAGANVNAESSLQAPSSSVALGNRLTPLHLGVQKGHTTISCLLLARGASACALEAGGKRPLDFVLPALTSQRHQQPEEIAPIVTIDDCIGPTMTEGSELALEGVAVNEATPATVIATTASSNRIELSIVPFLASVTRFLITSANSVSTNRQNPVEFQQTASPLRKRIESIVQTTLNSGVSATVLIAACLAAAMGLERQLQHQHEPPENFPSEDPFHTGVFSYLGDPVLELALQQCYLEACLSISTKSPVSEEMAEGSSALNDFFEISSASDNRTIREDGRSSVLQSGTGSPTGSSMSIANFLMPSDWPISTPMASTSSVACKIDTQNNLLPLNLKDVSVELKECLVCSSADRAAVLTPCGHIIACQTCTQMLKKCITCRQPITGYREIPACRECTFRPAVTLTRECNHFLVCRECLVPRFTRLNRSKQHSNWLDDNSVVGADDENGAGAMRQESDQEEIEKGNNGEDGEMRRHRLLLSLFNAGELCPDGLCPECGQAVMSVWSLEAACCQMEPIANSLSSGGDYSVGGGSSTPSVLAPQDLLIPISVAQNPNVWLAHENNQVSNASNMTSPRHISSGSSVRSGHRLSLSSTTSSRLPIPRCTQAGGLSNAQPNNLRPSGMTGHSRTIEEPASTRELKRLQHELQAMREQTRCPICLDRSRNLVFMCGHATCQWCGDQVAACPICRRAVTGRIVLY